MFDLFGAISKFRPVEDRESDVAFYRTHVPWEGSEAYLNIVFKPATFGILSSVDADLRIPPPYREFLRRYNGAILLSGAINLYGVVREGQLLNRRDSFSLPPFNILQGNLGLRHLDRDRFLRFGSYGFDGSLLCIDRRDHHIEVLRKGESMPYHIWGNLDEWLEIEVRRVSELFDPSGRALADKSETLPPPMENT